MAMIFASCEYAECNVANCTRRRLTDAIRSDETRDDALIRTTVGDDPHNPTVARSHLGRSTEIPGREHSLPQGEETRPTLTTSAFFVSPPVPAKGLRRAVSLPGCLSVVARSKPVRPPRAGIASSPGKVSLVSRSKSGPG
jgi:hypothetical protein